MGCVFPKVFDSILLHAEFGLNDHRKDAPHFSFVDFFYYFKNDLELIKTLSLVNDYYSDVNSFEERSARRRAENWGRRYNQVRFSANTSLVSLGGIIFAE